MGGELFIIPYDGKNVGEFISDAIRNIQGNFSIKGANSNDGGILVPDGRYGAIEAVQINDTAQQVQTTQTQGKKRIVMFDASFAVPTAHENRPSSISAMFFISY